jgi:predicted tellurium resistance membrane protein TerC
MNHLLASGVDIAQVSPEGVGGAIIALIALTAMEIVLGIDNIVFIAILTGRLPIEQQPSARRLGLALAMITRVMLLLTITWIMQMNEPFFYLSSLGIPERWLPEAVDGVSVKDLILLGGGLFLVGKSVHEIHNKIEGHAESHKVGEVVSYRSVIMQIVVIDVVFSLDSVITAVGMANQIWVMITAVVIAIGIMMIFAEKVSAFVERHPTIKMLALSFLILIGVMLVAEGVGTHINKGYIYFAMAFALGVEALNLRAKSRSPAPGHSGP